MSLPSADDLFRKTAEGQETGPESTPESSPGPARVRAVPNQPADDESEATSDAGRGADRTSGKAKRPSGRVRHDEKMTVYITSDEPLDLEHARLSLRRTQGLAVDRGRLVREAVALVLADYEAQGDDSALVRRLSED